MKNLLLACLLTLFVVSCAPRTKVNTTFNNANIKLDDDTPFSDGMPFGEISDQDITNLITFAESHGYDFESAMTKIYETGDTNALGSVFALSLHFTSLDQNARSYGQIIFSGFLNWGEGGQVDFCEVMTKQPPEVQQRIRDFMFYATLKCTPKDYIESSIQQTQKDYPALMPDGYKFGSNDPIFSPLIK